MKWKLKILILAGGPSSEHEVSLASGKNVLGALDRKKYQPVMHIIPKRGNPDKSVVMAIKRYTPDVVFIALHGAYGEDGKAQKLLDKIDIHYTGSGALASAFAMDKLKSAELFQRAGLLVPRVIRNLVPEHVEGLPRNSSSPPFMKGRLGGIYPLVVKPVDAGSSVGVTIVTSSRDLPAAILSARKASSRVMAQEYIEGREVTCGVLEDSKTGIPFALPPTEIVPKTSRFFDYRSKYTVGASREITPARFPQKIIKAIQKNSLVAHKVLGCRGMSRTDIIIENPKSPPGARLASGGEIRNPKIYVLETNTIPGMTKTSLLPQGAKAAGISFSQLLDILIGASLSQN